MRILIIPHVGETFGHYADALSIARELALRGCTIEIASTPRVASAPISSGLQCDFHPIRWNWSHNSCELDGLSSEFVTRILETTEDLMSVVKQSSPDLILGLPGFASTQVARHYGVPHISILHGVHLAPLIEWKDTTVTELAVLDMCRKICLGALNDAFQVLNRTVGLPSLDYGTFITSETIFIPQPNLPFQKLDNMFITQFIRASLGPQFDGDQTKLEGSCYVTFGSGNPCDITRVILLAREVFPRVVANTGRLNLGPFPSGVITRSFIASSSLAGHVAAVVSHGGVGTIGTFAEWGTPQLIIPTELTQAAMAIYSSRAGIAKYVGLESFVKRSRLGRQLPDFTDE